MKWPPTDLALLEEIYRRYYAQFSAFSKESPTRSAKVYVPINVEELAAHFGVDKDIIFGRLYYHLEPKYGFRQADGARVPFFMLRTNDKEVHAVQFPLLASVIATLRDERQKHQIATWLSILALVVAAISTGVSISQ